MHHYTSETGTFNLPVILRAVHSVACREGSERVCRAIIGILGILMDMGVIPSKEPPEVASTMQVWQGGSQIGGSHIQRHMRLSYPLHSGLKLYAGDAFISYQKTSFQQARE